MSADVLQAVGTHTGSANGSNGNADQSADEARTCRLCWSPDSPELGELLSPCSCSGTMQYIHIECLRSWQQAQRSQHRYSRALVCELCRQPYNVPEQYVASPSVGELVARRLVIVKSALLWLFWIGPPARGSNLLQRWWRLQKVQAFTNGLGCAVGGGIAGCKHGFYWGRRHALGTDARLLHEVLLPLEGIPLPPLQLLRIASGTLFYAPPLTGAVLGVLKGFLYGYAVTLGAHVRMNELILRASWGKVARLGTLVGGGVKRVLMRGRRAAAPVVADPLLHPLIRGVLLHLTAWAGHAGGGGRR